MRNHHSAFHHLKEFRLYPTVSYIFVLLLFCFVSNSLAQQGNSTEAPSNLDFAFLVFPKVFNGITVEGLEVPIQIRAFLYLNMVTFNAWSNFHPTAVDIFGRSRFKRPTNEHTRENKELAVIYALLRLYEADPNSFGGPAGLPAFRQLMLDEGLDPDDHSNDTTTPIGIGNREGMDTARLMKIDKWNSLGDLTSSNPEYAQPFADPSDYVPENTPWKILFPFLWQPPLETDRLGFFFRQEHVTPHAGSTIAFSLTPRDVRRRRVRSPYLNRVARTGTAKKADLNTLKRNAEKVFQTSASLTEEQGLLAEFFDNKVASFRTEANPFGVASIATAVRFSIIGPAFGFDVDDDIPYGLAANIVTYDSMVVVWREKLRQDAIRPTGQTMEFLFGDKEFMVWGGPGQKPTNIKAGEWQPYIRTMPHSEFPSGSSCLCEALIEQTLTFTKGRDDFPFNVTIPKGSSKFYPGEVPRRDVTIPINRLSDWTKLCGESRLYAGVHFEPAVEAGRQLCKGIGKASQSAVDDMVAGKPNLKWLKWLDSDVDRFWERD